MHGYQFKVISTLKPMTVDDYENISAALCDRTNNYYRKYIKLLMEFIFNFQFRNQNINISTEAFFNTESFSKIEAIINPPEDRQENMNNVDKAALSSAVREIFFGIQEDEYLILRHS